MYKGIKYKLSQKDQHFIYSKFTGRCAYCGQPLNYLDFTVDHIIPNSKGGSDSVRNLVPACSDCNWCKDNMTPAEFKQEIAIMKQLLPLIPKLHKRIRFFTKEWQRILPLFNEPVTFLLG